MTPSRKSPLAALLAAAATMALAGGPLGCECGEDGGGAGGSGGSGEPTAGSGGTSTGTGGATGGGGSGGTGSAGDALATQDAPRDGAGAPADTTTDRPPSPLQEALEPGEYVQLAEARIVISGGAGSDVPADTFASVRAKLGAGRRAAAPEETLEARRYDWTLSNDVRVAVAFANTNLDADDATPGQPDDADEVLWVTVAGGFRGRTSRQVALGVARADVERTPPQGHGPPPTTVASSDPPGTLARYFSHGLLVVYGADDRIQAITISRSYNQEPSARVDLARLRLDFNAQGVLAGRDGLLPGTARPLVLNILGHPDGDGLRDGVRVWSYPVIGIDVVFEAGQSVRTVTISPPYYGALDTGGALGAPRADIEAAIGLGAGAPSTQPGVVCYPEAATPRLAVRYGGDPAPTAVQIVLSPPRCP